MKIPELSSISPEPTSFLSITGKTGQDIYSQKCMSLDKTTHQAINLLKANLVAICVVSVDQAESI